MTTPKKTLHHQLPKSMGGSNEDVNTIMLPEDLHVEWHKWTGNYMPTDVARLMMLTSIGWEDGAFDPIVLNYMLRGTLRNDLEMLYQEQSITRISSYEAIPKSISRARHCINHLLFEQDIVQTLQAALAKKGPFPWEISPEFVPTYLEFFSTNKPQEALERLYTGTIGHELAWMGPLKPEVHESNLQTITDSAHPTWKPLANCRQEFLGVLARHQNNLEKQERRWRETFGSFVDEEPEVLLPSLIWEMPAVFKAAVEEQL